MDLGWSSRFNGNLVERSLERRFSQMGSEAQVRRSDELQKRRRKTGLSSGAVWGDELMGQLP